MQVFLATYGDCGRGRSDDWRARLNVARATVVVSLPSDPHAQILSQLAQADLVVGPIDFGGTGSTQWAAVMSSALAGRDMVFGVSPGTWDPKPTFVWWAEERPPHRIVDSMVSEGAIRLSANFDDAVKLVVATFG